MKAYRTYATVTDPQNLLLINLPFKPGQRVEVLVLVDDSDRVATLNAFDQAFKATQALPHIQSLTDADIEVEIAANRSDNASNS